MMAGPGKNKTQPLKKYTPLIKIRLRNRIKYEFLADHLLVYIEYEISKDFTTKMINN
jgi:hypothetical protein